MSKQCYWSSGARRKDWSVNSLRCWRCLVINTPDETPSKAHPSFTGSLLLLALSLSLHQAPQCFLLLAPDAWLHWLHLVLVWSYFFPPLLIIALLLFLILYWIDSSLYPHCILTYQKTNLFPSLLPVFLFLPTVLSHHRSIATTPGTRGNLQAVIIKISRRANKADLVCITYIDSLVNHVKISQMQTHLIQFARKTRLSSHFRVSYCSMDRR